MKYRYIVKLANPIELLPGDTAQITIPYDRTGCKIDGMTIEVEKRTCKTDIMKVEFWEEK
jgi:hypothetical protein